MIDFDSIKAEDLMADAIAEMTLDSLADEHEAGLHTDGNVSPFCPDCEAEDFLDC
jgi:hypothetical protein